MEHKFDELPTCFAVSPSEINSDLIAVGFVDGTVDLRTIEGEAEEDGKATIESLWDRQQKRAVRSLLFSTEADALYSLSKNRSICSYDVETGKRTRVIRVAHDGAPMTMCRLPVNAWHGQTFATADEQGQVRTWDWRVPEPIICTYDEQHEAVNALVMDGTQLLAASSDGTIAAYEVRRKKLNVRSELMHSELMSIAVTKKFTYVGAGDGHIEVFKRGMYGNILERIESGFEKSVSSLVELRRGLLLTGSDEDSALRLLHTEPNKRLGEAGKHGEGGIDQLATTVDGQWIVSLASFDQSIKLYPLPPVLERVPVLTSDRAGKKKKVVSENFFDDLVNQSKGEDDDDDEEEGEGEGEDSDESGDSEVEGDEEEEEEGEESDAAGDDGADDDGEEEVADDEDEEEDVADDDDQDDGEESGEDEEEEEEEEPVKPPQGKKRRLK
ncbi:hypothetical protein PENTCL1PPCAC_9595 [Pristionchus entomophagus]|uniref:WD40 domain-containing protein n=1 Tax=Pristionchus entomophagus TaxID=358040 RepID=A0AAV5T507_9BILA|nr:hypothetical protein PENTCL1PPCAC_9595 [Pristionchus entomophagus]